VLIIDKNLPYLLNNINHPVGGATIQTRSWMYGFESLGYDLVIASIINIKNRSTYNIENIRHVKNTFNIFLFFSYYKIIKKYKPDFIYISTPFWSNIFVGIAAKLLKVKIVQRISNDNVTDRRAKLRFGKVKYHIYRSYLALSDVVLCQNEYQLSNLKTKYPKKIIGKIYNPYSFDKGFFEKIERSYVAWVGIFQQQKNLLELLIIIKNLPFIKFRIAGKGYSNIDKLTEETIEELKKLKNVSFVGFLTNKDIPVFLSKAICLLNTSHSEGFSNTYLEAFSVNTPVITRRQTDPDSIIENNNLGKVFDDYSGIPQAIEDLVSSGKEYNHLSTYLFTNHSPKLLAKRLIALIDSEV
jgi:glycosyltransferase involved in cell wall biosynthesis